MSHDNDSDIVSSRFNGALRRRQTSGAEPSKDRWLLTYADLITLLLAFFIIMYSMSHLDAKRFGKVSEALSGIFAGEAPQPLLQAMYDDQAGSGPLKFTRLRSLMRSIENKAYERGIDQKKFESEITERGLVIHITESALFEPGEAKLSPAALDLLDLVADEIKTVPNHVRVEGHTDTSPIQTARFPSNWELSSARATEVVRYLINAHGYPPKKISALGYGEFRPIRPNNTPENRAKNRRVDVVVLNLNISATEPSSSLYVPGK